MIKANKKTHQILSLNNNTVLCPYNTLDEACLSLIFPPDYHYLDITQIIEHVNILHSSVTPNERRGKIGEMQKQKVIDELYPLGESSTFQSVSGLLSIPFPPKQKKLDLAMHIHQNI